MKRVSRPYRGDREVTIPGFESNALFISDPGRITVEELGSWASALAGGKKLKKVL